MPGAGNGDGAARRSPGAPRDSRARILLDSFLLHRRELSRKHTYQSLRKGGRRRMSKLSILLPTLPCILLACVSQRSLPPITAFTAAGLEAYRTLGLAPGAVEPWEDGMRTTGGRGSYEWWYFDFTFANGTTLVIAFYTKNVMNPGGPMEPTVTFALDRPDGFSLHRSYTTRPGDFSAARNQCGVRMGPNSATGDLHDYLVHVQMDGVRADLALHGTVPPWRPGTGHLFFGSHYFAWLCSVPQGSVRGTLVIDGAAEQVSGVGYHDHNWGDTSMVDLIHHWYWGRAQAGPYTVIASDIFPNESYGGRPVPIFMLARDGARVVDDASKVHVSFDGFRVDELTGKPVASTVVYDYVDGPVHFRVTFRRQTALLRIRLIDVLSGLQAFLARIAGFDGAYLRFTGPTTVERFDSGTVVESYTERTAVWELMYFGNAP
jgi:hypothetical protein